MCWVLLRCRPLFCFLFVFFKQKTAYDMRISDWSSDVCSSDLPANWKFILQESSPACAGVPASNPAHTSASTPVPLIRFIVIPHPCPARRDRKSVVQGTSVSVRVDLGGRSIVIKKIRVHKQAMKSLHNTHISATTHTTQL